MFAGAKCFHSTIVQQLPTEYPGKKSESFDKFSDGKCFKIESILKNTQICHLNSMKSNRSWTKDTTNCFTIQTTTL